MDEIKINDESVQNIVKALSSGLDSVFSNSMYGAVYNALTDRDEHIEMTKQQKSVTGDKQNTDTFLSRMDNETALSDVLVALSEKVGAFGEKVDAFDPNNTSSIQEPPSSQRQFFNQSDNGNVPPPNDNSDAIKSIVDNSKESGQNSVAVLQQMLGIMQSWNQQRLETMNWEMRSYKPYYQKMNQMIDDGKFDDLMKDSTFTPGSGGGGLGGGLWSTLGKALLALAGGAAGLLSGVLAGAVDSYGKIWKRMFKTIEEVVTGNKPTPQNPKGSEPKTPKTEETGKPKAGESTAPKTEEPVKPKAGELKDVVSKAENVTESGTKNIAETTKTVDATTKDVKAMSDAVKNASPDAQVKRVPVSKPSIPAGVELDPAGSITKGIKPAKAPWWDIPKALNIGKDAWKDMGWLSKSFRVTAEVGKGVGSKFPIISGAVGGINGLDRTLDFVWDPTATKGDVAISAAATVGDAIMGYTGVDAVGGAAGGATTGFARSRALDQIQTKAENAIWEAMELGFGNGLTPDEFKQFQTAVSDFKNAPGALKGLIDGLFAQTPSFSEQAAAHGSGAMKQLVDKKMEESGALTNSGTQAFWDFIYNDEISDSTIDDLMKSGEGAIFMDEETSKKLQDDIKFMRRIVRMMDKRIDLQVLTERPELLSADNYRLPISMPDVDENAVESLPPELQLPMLAAPDNVRHIGDNFASRRLEAKRMRQFTRDEAHQKGIELPPDFNPRTFRLGALQYGDVWKRLSSMDEEARMKQLASLIGEEYAKREAKILQDLYEKNQTALFGTIH